MNVFPPFSCLLLLFLATITLSLSFPADNSSFDFLHGVNYLDRTFLYRPQRNVIKTSCNPRSLGLKSFRLSSENISTSTKSSLLGQYEAVRIVHICPNIKNTLDFHLRILRHRSSIYDLHNRTGNANIGCNSKVLNKRVQQRKPPATQSVFGTPSPKSFDPNTFLHRMINKQLTFFGDSIGRQIFLDLVAELNPYQTQFSYLDNDEETEIMVNSTITTFLPHAHRLFSKRYYAAFNVTILYYDDGLGRRFFSHLDESVSQYPPQVPNRFNSSHPHLWDVELRKSDIIVVGIGAWFKPWFFPQFNETDYYDDMRQKRKALNETLWQVRQLFQKEIPRANIIWRLNAHAGMIDELSSLGKKHNLTFDTTTKGFYRHNQGELWSNFANGAIWPIYYNDLYLPIAEFFGDYVLDYWQVSVQYLSWAKELKLAAYLALQKQYSVTNHPHKVDQLVLEKLLLQLEQRFHPLLDPSAIKSLSSFLQGHLQQITYPNQEKEILSLIGDFYPVMSDSLHYCPGGVPRAGMFLLFDLLEDIISFKSVRHADMKPGHQSLKRKRKRKINLDHRKNVHIANE